MPTWQTWISSVASLTPKRNKMQAHQQISAVIDHIVEEGSNLDPATIEDYKKLNDKINVVISKIMQYKFEVFNIYYCVYISSP